MAKRHESPRSRRQIVSGYNNRITAAGFGQKKFNNTLNFADTNHMTEINSYFMSGNTEKPQSGKIGNYQYRGGNQSQ